MALALLVFAVSPIFAGENCSAQKTDAKACCSAHDTNATKASAKTTCTQADMDACAKAMNMSPEECAKMCGAHGTMSLEKISVKGMMCGSCEAKVTKAIEGVDGVNKVIKVNYKDGTALVCVNKKNTNLTNLTKAISDSGFPAEIIPAVAKTDASDKMTGDKASCAKSCAGKDKASCDAKKTEKKAEGTK